ncbi:MAG: hypothetical protein R3A51_00895 [Nannocystaceae bacterium]|nr:hypothetical protein [Myxococcales bacterium]
MEVAGVLVMQPTSLDPNPTAGSARAVSILARSLFRQMREQGYSAAEIIGLSSELLDLVSSDLKRDRTQALADAAE